MAFSFSPHSLVLASFYQLEPWDTGRSKNPLGATELVPDKAHRRPRSFDPKVELLSFLWHHPCLPNIQATLHCMFRKIKVQEGQATCPVILNYEVAEWGWNSDPRLSPSFSGILSCIAHSTASQGDREDKKEQRGRKPQRYRHINRERENRKRKSES